MSISPNIQMFQFNFFAPCLHSSHTCLCVNGPTCVRHNGLDDICGPPCLPQNEITSSGVPSLIQPADRPTTCSTSSHSRSHLPAFMMVLHTKPDDGMTFSTTLSTNPGYHRCQSHWLGCPLPIPTNPYPVVVKRKNTPYQ